jgi:hypothetical protein
MIAKDFPDMEDEWRELYLNEPPMSDYFNDGSWMPEVIPTLEVSSGSVLG